MISLDTTSYLLANTYRINTARLNESMARVSSGNRLMTPSDDVRDFFRVKAFKSDLVDLSEVQNQISYGQGFMKAADQLGGAVLGDLQKMQEYLRQYYSTGDPIVQNASKAQFNAFRDKVNGAIDSGYYSGKKLIADGNGTPAVTVLLDGRHVSSTFNIEYGAGEKADASGLTIGATDFATESEALQTQLDRVGNYLARTTAYTDALDVYSTLTSKKIATYQQGVQDMQDDDQGAQMMKETKASISVQMTVSMMAQSNMIQSSVLNLLGNNGK
jgi:flagellin